jgi:hypothetical protein
LLLWSHMRHTVWLAGCLLLFSCTVNNDNLNADAGGNGGASATGGQVGTGGQVATGGQVGTGGQVATGGQPGTGGSPTGGHGGNGGSGTGGSGSGTGGQGGGESCDALETDYDNALAAAKKCMLGATDQCQQLVSSSLSCSGCKQYVNDATMLNAIQTEWASQKCDSVPHVCPAIACAVPTASVCTSSSTSGGPGGGAAQTGTCSAGPLTGAN